MAAPINDDFKLSPERELDRILSLQEAARVSSLSTWTWRREHADKIITLSPRRLGVRLRDALMLRSDPPKRKSARG
jgi:hypothetical protein